MAGATKAASQQKPTSSYAEAANFVVSNIAVPTKESADDVLISIEQLEVALFPSNTGPRLL
jgi:hypothetical protein